MRHSAIFAFVLYILLATSSCTPSEEPTPSVGEPTVSADDVIPSETTIPGSPDVEPGFAFPKDWTVIECLNDDPNLLFDYRMVGESEDAFFLGVLYGEEGKRTLDLRKISKMNFSVLDKITFAAERYPTLHNTGSSFIIHGVKQADIYNYNFKLIGTIAVPDEIQAKMVYEFNEEKEMYLRYFAGYAVTPDASKFYYANEEGLFEFDTATKKETLFLEAPLLKTPLSYEYMIPGGLQLRADEKVLFFTRTFYEGLMDAGYVNLSEGIVAFLPIYQYADIRYEYSPHYLYFDYDQEETTLRHYNLMPGETNILMKTSKDEFLSMYITNERYCSFSVSTISGETNYYRYDTESKSIELVCKDNDFLIDSTTGSGENCIYSNLMGVLKDGRVLLHFFCNDVHALVLTGG